MLSEKEKWYIETSTERLEKNLKECKKEASVLLEKIDNYEKKIEEYKHASYNDFYGISKEEYDREWSKKAADTYVAFLNLYRKLHSPIMHGIVNTCDLSNEEIKKIENNCIEVRIENCKLYVKTPLLFSKYHKYSSKGNASFSNDYSSVFSYEIAQKLEELRNKIPKISDKVITVFSVYNSKKSLIPDADNLDTKKIIDAISEFFPGGDSARYCSFFLMNEVRNDITEGSFFIVSDSANATFTREKLAEEIRSIYSTKNGNF